MPGAPVPLSVLDLAPVSAGSTITDALRNTIDLACRAEEFGYLRYWLAEHHFAPGVASSAPAVLIAEVAAATRQIRVGAGAVQLGHHTAVAVVEQFGTLAALHPGRIDLGLGRSGQRRAEAAKEAARGEVTVPAGEAAGGADVSPGQRSGERRIVKGLLIPPPFPVSRLLASPRFAVLGSLLQQPGAQSPDFAEQVDDILAMLSGSFYPAEDTEVHTTPGEGAELDVWILGSSAGQSAQVAGALGLPFAANYHVSPATVLEAVEAYRSAFKPSAYLAEPYVMVSADAVVGPDEATARELASPYGLWVRSIRSGAGAIPFPSPEQAAFHAWSEQDRALVTDRTSTQFVGSPETVVRGLRVLRDATDADELVITTITHRHADRVRSYALLAKEWSQAAG
jgi:alkanesulfonate monooxygenase SsuD/methylene tetrahydromethanopterin reductase-like flavin-dependent oxidoreductase (luciferase family)